MLGSIIWFIVFVCIIWLIITNCDKICGWLSGLKLGKGSTGSSLDSSTASAEYDGAYDNTYDGGSPSRVATDTYERVLPYTIEVGSSTHIEQYLTELLGKQTVSDWTRSQGVQKPKLLELLLAGAIRTQAETADELCTLLDLRYLWFIPANKRTILLNSHKYDLGLRSELRSKIRKDASTLSETEIDKLTDKLLVVAKSYHKLKSNYVKKPVNAINKAKDNAFELDYVGIETPIKYLIGCVKYVQGAPKSIDEKLRDIDLMTMYPKDPYAVRLFIDRIRRDIKNIEDLPSTKRFGIGSLLRDLEHESDVMKWENRAKRAEREKENLKREQDNLQRALEESKLTAREEELKRREAEVDKPAPQVSKFTGEKFGPSSPFYVPQTPLEARLRKMEQATKMPEKKRATSAP